jgi:hypothetical protein
MRPAMSQMSCQYARIAVITSLMTLTMMLPQSVHNDAYASRRSVITFFPTLQTLRPIITFLPNLPNFTFHFPQQSLTKSSVSDVDVKNFIYHGLFTSR